MILLTYRNLLKVKALDIVTEAIHQTAAQESLGGKSSKKKKVAPNYFFCVRVSNENVRTHYGVTNHLFQDLQSSSF